MRKFASCQRADTWVIALGLEEAPDKLHCALMRIARLFAFISICSTFAGVILGMVMAPKFHGSPALDFQAGQTIRGQFELIVPGAAHGVLRVWTSPPFPLRRSKS